MLWGLVLGACLIAGIVPVDGSYAWDLPLQIVFFRHLHGGYLFSEGDGGYSGTLMPGTGYTASFSRTLPDGSEVMFERLYVYWAWSRHDQVASYPVMEIRTGGPDGPLLERSARYADSKGFASKNDFFTGMDSYLLPETGADTLTIDINNSASDGSTFIIQGTAILSVYNEPNALESAIWVAEGGDLLYRSYGIPPELATTRVEFPGRIDIPRVDSACLFLVAPSAGFSRDETTGMNQLLLNTPGKGALPPLIEPFLSVLFPRYKGKSWTDVFSADENRQVGTAFREIRPFLRYSDNFIEVRDNGDYFQLCNAILQVTYRGEAP